MAAAEHEHPAGRCVYCGMRLKARAQPATCSSHADLLRLDPHYNYLSRQ